LTSWEKSHRQALEGERAGVAQRREAARKRRCRELLGDGLTEEAQRHTTL
jgi:hypothetical protein